MNLTDEMLLTGLVVIAGRWAQGQGLDIKVGIALVMALLFLTVLPDELASHMSALILVTSLIVYGQSILIGLGFVRSTQTNAGAAVKAINGGKVQFD